MNTKKLERPFTVIFEDGNGERKPLKRISVCDKVFEFILEGGHSVVLRETVN